MTEKLTVIEQSNDSTESYKSEMTVEEIKRNLFETFDLDSWWINWTKSSDQLLDELRKWESVLTIRNWEILRAVSWSTAKVYFLDNDGQLYILEEEKQVFDDGYERKREWEFSIMEKSEYGEDPETTIKRWLEEELWISDWYSLEYKETKEWENDSPSYPGMNMHYTETVYDVVINTENFNPDWYVEEWNWKVTYFKWKKV